MKGSRIELGDVTPHNIKQLKRLNQVIFPVSYNDKFYKDVLEVGELAKLAYFNDIAVGAVCCRVDHSQNQKRLYIMTLGCLAPYRRLGIGTKMLNHVLNICEKDGTFDNIYLSRIELGDVTPHNIKQLKRLNQVIFPVSYNDKFYKDVLEVGELAKLAYFNDIAVGAVCCRVDHSQNQKRLYIMTLGCLAPYRRLGIGTKMLNHVLNICEKDGTFDNIYLHVQISNESAIDFYRKFGFEIIETKKNYYKRIEPADAHVLQKNLKVPSGQNADVQKTDN